MCFVFKRVWIVTINEAKNMFDHGFVKSIKVWQFIANYTLVVYVGDNAQTINTARGQQKLYKKFESVLNDFAYITGKECKEISLTI